MIWERGRCFVLLFTKLTVLVKTIVLRMLSNTLLLLLLWQNKTKQESQPHTGHVSCLSPVFMVGSQCTCYIFINIVINRTTLLLFIHMTVVVVIAFFFFIKVDLIPGQCCCQFGCLLSCHSSHSGTILIVSFCGCSCCYCLCNKIIMS